MMLLYGTYCWLLHEDERFGLLRERPDMELGNAGTRRILGPPGRMPVWQMIPIRNHDESLSAFDPEELKILRSFTNGWRGHFLAVHKRR